MPGRFRFKFAWRGAALVLLSHLAAVPYLYAQTDPPVHMCGDGSTFTVDLPGALSDLTHPDIYSFTVSGSSRAPNDSVTLPNGCRVYALLVGGYAQNEEFDRVVFYKLAEFVAQNDGYVHVAWWNNLLKPYMAGPLHNRSVTVNPPILFGNDYTLHTGPAGPDRSVETTARRLFLPNDFTSLPKALPAEDFQFRDDAAAVIRAIKTHNPNAIVVVAGHGMGGASAARLASEKSDVAIDLLAIIDPVGNRDRPLDPAAELLSNGKKLGDFLNLASTRSGVHFNWSRARATRVFQGYKKYDCIRGPLGFCAPVGPQNANGLGTYCVPTDPFLHAFPTVPTKTIFCPVPGPYIDPGSPMTFKNNVKHLYHRWQKEYFGPADFWGDDRLYTHPATRSTTSVLARNYQKSIGTCSSGTDPRDPSIACSSHDGHGEIVGMRGGTAIGVDRTFPGLEMRQWPADATGRQQKFVEMAGADASWPHRPVNPDLCTVCDDMIDVVQHLLDQQPPPADLTAPTSSATLVPEPHESGWHNEDATVSIVAADNPGGSGVKQIDVALSGAQSGSFVAPGDSAEPVVTQEGTTTVTFFARDHVGLDEPPQTVSVMIDKTPPAVAATVIPAPNGFGWHAGDVTVTFTAEDVLSGVAALSQATPLVVSAEGAQQEIAGTATDLAQNVGSGVVTLNIDRSAPTLTGTPDRPADRNGWYNRPFTIDWSCTDALSGVDSASGPTVYAGPDVASATLEGACADRAGHQAAASVAFNFDATPPSIAFAGITPAANPAGWHRTDATLTWACADAPSGPLAASVSRIVGGEGLGLFASAQCEDAAGNTASATGPAVNIDRTAPTIDVASPPHGNVYLLNALVPSSYACADPLSGVSACAGPVASGAPVDTSRPGSQQFTVTALDAAGNATNRTHAYHVRYQFSGFLSPVRSAPIVNRVNAGRTIPLKYQLRDAHGTLISDLGSFASLQLAAVACDSGATATELPESVEAAGNSSVRFTDEKFQIDWKTPSGLTGCHALRLRLADGTEHTAMFEFR